MLSLLTIFGSGLLFAAGLSLSGLTQPEKVVGFLDFTGEWDPALALVMAGALAVYAVALPLMQRRRSGRPVLAKKFGIPTRRDITGDLVGGAVLFGAGWGIAGFCPGPALASVGAGSTTAIAFLAAMFSGMGLFRVFDAWRKRRAAQPASAQPRTERYAQAAHEGARG